LSMGCSNAAHDREWADAPRERRHNRSTGVAKAARLEVTARGKALSAMEARARSQISPAGLAARLWLRSETGPA